MTHQNPFEPLSDKTEANLRLLLANQLSLNYATFPDWKARLASGDVEYGTAFLGELIEFKVSTGYEKWKKTTVDPVNQFVELIDALHFLLTIGFGRHHQLLSTRIATRPIPLTDEYCIDSLLGVFKLGESLHHLSQSTRFGRNLSAFQTLVMCATMLDSERSVPPTIFSYAFLECMFYLGALFSTHCNASADKVFNGYMAKSALNRFRQANGYKAGAYKKMWTIDGVSGEDNYFLFNRLHTMTEEQAAAFTGPAVIEWIQSQYDKVSK